MAVVIATSEIELAFVAWLREHSRNVQPKFGRWLENQHGECCCESYCPECVTIQRFVERHSKTGYTSIAGWDVHYESDSPKWCKRCGCLLNHSLTQYGVDEEIAVMAAVDDPDDHSCHIWHEMLTGMGSYIRKKHWPLIEPHAKRFMAAKHN